MDPIDPAFLDRSFDRSFPGSERVQRVRGVRDEQPGEQWDEEAGDQDKKRKRRKSDRREEDVYEPGTPLGETADAPEAADDPESVIVDLNHQEQAPPQPPDDEADGPHIDISV